MIPFEMAQYSEVTTIFMIISIAFYMALLAVFQPYKNITHLRQDIVLFFGLLLWNSSVLVGLLGWNHFASILHMTILAISSLIPFLYFVGFIAYWLFVVKKLHTWIRSKMKCRAGSHDQVGLLDH